MKHAEVTRSEEAPNPAEFGAFEVSLEVLQEITMIMFIFLHFLNTSSAHVYPRNMNRSGKGSCHDQVRCDFTLTLMEACLHFPAHADFFL